MTISGNAEKPRVSGASEGVIAAVCCLTLLFYAFQHPLDSILNFSWKIVWVALAVGSPKFCLAFLGLVLVTIIGWSLQSDSVFTPGRAAVATGAAVAAEVADVAGSSAAHSVLEEPNADVDGFALGLAWILCGYTVLLAFELGSTWAAGLLFLPCLTDWRRNFLRCLRVFPKSLSRWRWAFLLVLAVLWGPLGGLPPTAHDDLVYHLDMRDGLADQGTLFFVTDQQNSFRPALHAVFQAWLKNLGGETLAGNGNFFCVFATIFFLLRLPGLVGVFAALTWLVHPQWVRLIETSFAEPLLCLLVILPFLLSHRRPALAGCLLGLLPAVKYSGLYFCPIFGFFYLALNYRATEPAMPTAKLRALAGGVVIGVLLTAVPMYGRNLWFVGNPVFPHGRAFFASRFVSLPDQMMEVFRGLPVPISWDYGFFLERFGQGRTILDFLLGPISVSTMSHFHDRQYSLAFFDGQLGFVPLLLWLGLWFLPPRNRQQQRCFLLLGLCCYFIWWKGPQMVRLILPLAGVSVVLVPFILEPLRAKLRYFLLVITSLSLLWPLHQTLMRLQEALPYLSGVQCAHDFQATRLPALNAMAWINSNTASSARILVLLEERTYPLRRTVAWNAVVPIWFGNFTYLAGNAGNVEKILDAHGISHILMPKHGLFMLQKLIEDANYRNTVEELFFRRWRVEYHDDNALVFARVLGST